MDERNHGAKNDGRPQPNGKQTGGSRGIPRVVSFYEEDASAPLPPAQPSAPTPPSAPAQPLAPSVASSPASLPPISPPVQPAVGQSPLGQVVPGHSTPVSQAPISGPSATTGVEPRVDIPAGKGAEPDRDEPWQGSTAQAVDEVDLDDEVELDDEIDEADEDDGDLIASVYVEEEDRADSGRGEADQPVAPVFDAPYQPKRSKMGTAVAEVPYWVWLAIPVGLVVGIILVLIFAPSSKEEELASAAATLPSQQQVITEGAGPRESPATQGRPGADNPLPLATPAPPGHFKVEGFNLYSGPDDVQLNPGSVILPDERITFKLHYSGAQYVDSVQVQWEVNGRDWGTEEVHLNPWTTSQWFVRDRPESGWPEGRYRLTVFHEEKEVSSIFFEVSPTGLPVQDDAILLPGQPDEAAVPDTSSDDPVWPSATSSP